jgi:hypothetical protein
LCVHHRNRWIRANRPPIESWLLGCETFGRDRFDLRHCQCRCGWRSPTRSNAVSTSAAPSPGRTRSGERRFLLDAIGYLRDLVEGVGWDAEFPRDVWLLRRLGFPGRDTRLRFTGIEPIWLRQLTKRWARWRLSTGIAVATVSADIRAITMFARGQRPGRVPQPGHRLVVRG